jgi:acyl-coenzyme A synthetase/AMP-(fatty) acid ligase
MATLPLVQGFAAGAVFGYWQGRPVTVETFLRDVMQLAERLPGHGHVLNLSADRYRFTVGLAAALLREQITLLPPNDTPDLLGRLCSQYPDVYCLSDRPLPQAAIETVGFPDESAGAGPVPPAPAVPERQPAVIMFTSGSTGAPVPSRKTWGSLIRTARAECESLDLHAWPGLALLGTVPPQHAFGLESTVMIGMHCGFPLHSGRPFFPADIRSELASLPRPRGLVTTPVHLRVLLAEPDELPPVDFLLCATAPLSPQLAAAAEARFRAPLHEIYGCTESGGIASRRTVAAAEWRALRDVTLRTDGRGTWVKGGPVETEVLLADIIELKRRGEFLLHGRSGDLVNIAGKRTSLAHLNYHLNSIEGVRDGVFVAPEAEDEGEGVARLVAYVVAPGLAAEDLLSALRQRIDAAFLPRPLHFVDALPRNATGKLPRHALDELDAGLARKTG